MNLTPLGLLPHRRVASRPPTACRSIKARDSVVFYHDYRLPFCRGRGGLVVFPAAATCAAMARAEGCCAQALCSFVCCSGSGCVRAGGCRAGTVLAPVLCCACSALLFQGCSGEDRGPCPAGPASPWSGDALPSTGSALHGRAGWWLL